MGFRFRSSTAGDAFCLSVIVSSVRPNDSFFQRCVCKYYSSFRRICDVVVTELETADDQTEQKHKTTNTTDGIDVDQTTDGEQGVYSKQRVADAFRHVTNNAQGELLTPGAVIAVNERAMCVRVVYSVKQFVTMYRRKGVLAGCSR